MHFPTFLSLSCALRLAAAGVIWIPAEFDPHEDARLTRRDTLVSCPASLPSHFTCPQSTTCLALNTSSFVQAALCCPAGNDCSRINPVNCDQSMQNATANPNSQLHVDPPTQLASCGSACCPPGYACTDGQCQSLPASTTASSTSSFVTTRPTAAPSSSSSSSSPGAAVMTPVPNGTPDNLGGGSQTHNFSGASFAAGFIPGLALGAFITACLILLCLRKRRSDTDSYTNEKQERRDTLTDLGTLSRRPTMHGRSISEPTADPTTNHRTDFIRGTPPRLPELVPNNNSSYMVEATGPITPARTPNAVRALFSRSPFLNQTPGTPRPTQPPIPAHLKRGTLSYTISPVRALKKQKSMHSLRRQMTDASHGSSGRNRPDVSRSGSTETIKVLMPSNEPYTPDQRLLTRVTESAPTTLDSEAYRGPTDSASTWRTTSSTEEQAPPQQAPATYASSSRYPTQTYTPTRVPATSAAEENGGLGTPYTPSRYYGNGNGHLGKGKATDVLIGDDGGLRVVREPRDKRDTTFSAMMERAGLRKSDLVMGTGGRSAL